jgi:hypothetical protein
VIESVTSRAAAATGGLTCGATWVFYQHNNNQVCLIGFRQGSLGQGATCIGPPFVGTIAPCTLNSYTSDQNNQFTIEPGVNPATGGPTATAHVINTPVQGGQPFNGTVTNDPSCAQGACTGFFTITGNFIKAGNSNTILAAYSIPATTGCVNTVGTTPPWSSPNPPFDQNNSITLPC